MHEIIVYKAFKQRSIVCLYTNVGKLYAKVFKKETRIKKKRRR